MLVRLTDKDGELLAVRRRYSDADAGGWRHEGSTLSEFAGRAVYQSFFAETDPMLRTAFYVDKVSLGSGTPCSAPKADDLAARPRVTPPEEIPRREALYERVRRSPRPSLRATARVFGCLRRL